MHGDRYCQLRVQVYVCPPPPHNLSIISVQLELQVARSSPYETLQTFVQKTNPRKQGKIRCESHRKPSKECVKKIQCHLAEESRWIIEWKKNLLAFILNGISINHLFILGPSFIRNCGRIERAFKKGNFQFTL